MQIESLLPVLVPVAFFLIGAITWVFTKESEAPESGSGRTGLETLNNANSRLSTTSRQSGTASAQSRYPTRQEPLPTQTGSRSSDILILDSKGLSSSSTSSNIRAKSQRRPSKTKQPEQIREIQSPSGRPDVLNHGMGESIGETIGNRLVLSPLELPPSPLLQQNTGRLAPIKTDMTPLSNVMPVRERDLQTLLRSRIRLQEAWIISEILLPPKCKRR